MKELGPNSWCPEQDSGVSVLSNLLEDMWPPARLWYQVELVLISSTATTTLTPTLEDWEQVKVTPVAWEKALLLLMDQFPKDQRQAAGKNSENEENKAGRVQGTDPGIAPKVVV